MQQAIAYNREHPKETFSAVADRFLIPSSSLHDRLMGTHAPPSVHGPRHLSVEQEDALLDKINAYAARGTLLTPFHITQLAAALSQTPLAATGPQLSSAGTRTPYPHSFTEFKR